MRDNKTFLLLIAIFLVAAVPAANSIWENYITMLMPKGHAQRVGTDGGPLMLSPALDGGNRPYVDERDAMCVPWGSVLVATCPIDTPVTVCMSLEDETGMITIGSGATGGVMTDTDDAGVPASGDGPCFAVRGRRDIKVSKAWYGGGLGSVTTSAIPTLPGQRDGVCTQAIDLTRSHYAGGNRGAPCNSASDCVLVDGGPGTCTDNSPTAIECAYFVVEAETEAVCDFELER